MSFDCDGKESVPIVLEGKIEKNCARAQCSVHSMTWKKKQTKTSEKSQWLSSLGSIFSLLEPNAYKCKNSDTQKKHIRERCGNKSYERSTFIISRSLPATGESMCLVLVCIGVCVCGQKVFTIARTPNVERLKWNETKWNLSAHKHIVTSVC